MFESNLKDKTVVNTDFKVQKLNPLKMCMVLSNRTSCTSLVKKKNNLNNYDTS